MGVESLIGLAVAGIGAASAHHTQAANASAQSQLNRETMDFNSREAVKAREWQAAQNVIDRQFNSAQAAVQRQFAANETALARNFNAQQSLLGREFEERMSSTAHQREVGDLRAAGLNPILSATGGNGASTPAAPVIGAPSPAAGVAASHNSSGGAQASVGALNAYMKKDVIGQFINSALESMRVNNDYIKAKAQDKSADAQAKEAETHRTESIQRIEESISRVGLNYDEHELNIIRKRGEEAQANLYEEKVLSEIQKRHNDMKVSEAMQYNLRKTADAAATAASAQAHLVQLKDEIEHAESPARVRSLIKQADMYESVLKKNEWAITDPKAAAQRKWWRENPEAAHANEFLDILGNVVHGSVGIHGGN